MSMGKIGVIQALVKSVQAEVGKVAVIGNRWGTAGEVKVTAGLVSWSCGSRPILGTLNQQAGLPA
jgi:hypothetical protein